MSRVFVTSDLHLQHRSIVEYEPARTIFSSVEEMDDAIEARWCEVVRPEDTVYVLGDISWNRAGLLRFGKWPGIKRIVLGNHDGVGRRKLRDYQDVARSVDAYKVVRGDILLAHIPIHIRSLLSRYRGQIHGHLHGHGSPDGPYANVCVELTDFRPVDLDAAIVGMEMARREWEEQEAAMPRSYVDSIRQAVEPQAAGGSL